MSEVEGVTFVGGKAIEQTTEAESNTPDDVRSEAMAAVRKAIAEAGKEAANEAKSAEDKDEFRKAVKKGEEAVASRDENGRFLPKDARNSGEEGEQVKTKTDGKDPREPKNEATKEEKVKDGEKEHSLKQVLKERKELASIKKQQTDELRLAQQQLAEQHRQFQEQVRQFEFEKQKLQRLKTDPASAIRELGYSDPEEYILELAREGTPEGRTAKELRETKRAIAEMQQWKRQQEQEAVANRQRFEETKNQKYREFVEQEFLKEAFNEERRPHVQSLFSKLHPTMIVALGDVVAEQYKQLSGRDATFEEIADYLEDIIGEWYTSRSGSQKGQPGRVAGALNSGQSTQGSATGRTLNPETTAERRSLGTVLRDLDGEERLAAARNAVRIALDSARTD